MSLIARLEFDDEDPRVRVSFTPYARALERHDPREWARVLRVLSNALLDQSDRVGAARLVLLEQLEHVGLTRGAWLVCCGRTNATITAAPDEATATALASDHETFDECGAYWHGPLLPTLD